MDTKRFTFESNIQCSMEKKRKQKPCRSILFLAGEPIKPGHSQEASVVL